MQAWTWKKWKEIQRIALNAHPRVFPPIFLWNPGESARRNGKDLKRFEKGICGIEQNEKEGSRGKLGNQELWREIKEILILLTPNSILNGEKTLRVKLSSKQFGVPGPSKMEKSRHELLGTLVCHSGGMCIYIYILYALMETYLSKRYDQSSCCQKLLEKPICFKAS